MGEGGHYIIRPPCSHSIDSLDNQYSEHHNTMTPNGSATAVSKTDYTRWRLKSERGRQTWHYLETDEELAAWPQTAYDKYHLGMDTVRRIAYLCIFIFNCSRVSPIIRNQERTSTPPAMDCGFSPSSSFRTVSGLASTEVRVFDVTLGSGSLLTLR